jgi:acetylornithine deacetylase
MGTLALLGKQPPASAAVIPEPSHFDAWIACRGVMYGTATITGRSAHAELPQPDWRVGGAVNAIAKLPLLLASLRALEEKWASKQHRYLAPPSIVPTLVRGGEFIASVPESCALTVDVAYLAADADSDGFGSCVRTMIETEIGAALAEDDWLVRQPVRWEWTSDYPPYELDGGHEVVAAVTKAAASLGRPSGLAGLNAWHDAASLGLFANIPALSCGPGRPEQAHTADESISVDDLTDGAKLFAVLLADYCQADVGELSSDEAPA